MAPELRVSVLKWPLALRDERLAKTNSIFNNLCLKVDAGTKEASAQSQGRLRGALGKLGSGV